MAESDQHQPAKVPPKKVLIIEDDAALLKVLELKISQAGFGTVTAMDGQSGLETALRENPDLILLDILMPKRSGFDMLMDLRKDKRGKQIPVFILTNVNENDAIYESVVLNSSAYFIKSNTPLEKIVEEVKNKLTESSI